MTSRGTSGSAERSTGTPARICRFARPDSNGLLAQQVLDAEDVVEGEVPVLAEEHLGQRLPAQLGPSVGIGDVAHDVRARRLAQLLGGLWRDQHECGHGRPLDRLEHQQTAHPVADRHRGGPEALHRGDHVLGVGLDVERGRVRRLRPVVVAQVERVALPAAAGEVVQVALPDPGACRARRARTGAACDASDAREARTRCTGRARAARSRPCGRDDRRAGRFAE